MKQQKNLTPKQKEMLLKLVREGCIMWTHTSGQQTARLRELVNKGMAKEIKEKTTIFWEPTLTGKCIVDRELKREILSNEKRS